MKGYPKQGNELDAPIVLGLLQCSFMVIAHALMAVSDAQNGAEYEYEPAVADRHWWGGELCLPG
ncbi:uncharacterized protein BO95DRAFT_443220 [Aspergillus brunneoviolaceus CBS 621.78]|uniref:Uncharacterized protein n=1 Tax=Aspergillus brunneoviolaceus CBS 621.78 TaxID=1450534 RepID=A0ACD1G7P3_9EURO|nr:hypothetical protein BO95DRAFT_443220 [Aspergillus brunneoviolaceus CBS 621.78]RAH45263.1 hypothetical protein BO95DRAFT_443220 [Aspergillus brunneoviolaceus CBS 621.78]